MPRGKAKSDNPSPHALYMREWRAKHPENREYQRAYHKSPKQAEKNRKRARAYYWENRNCVLQRAKSRNARMPKKGRPLGALHSGWKGDNVGYHALHAWVSRHKGKPSVCEHCHSTDAKRYEWANADHKYKRVLADWIRLCTKCHRKHDFDSGLSQKRKENAYYK